MKFLRFEQELEFFQECLGYMLAKKGLSRAIVFWLSFVGNITVIFQAISFSHDVIKSEANVNDLVIWYSIAFGLMMITPRILDFSSVSEAVYIKAYTILINVSYSLIFVILVKELFFTKGYINSFNLVSGEIDVAIGFTYINSLIIIYISCWLFSIYFKKDLPSGYLNYASLPIFVVVMTALIYAIVFGAKPSLSMLFLNSDQDGLIRLLIILLSTFMFLIIVKNTFTSKKPTPQEAGQSSATDSSNNN